jgi:hypothetical protein
MKITKDVNRKEVYVNSKMDIETRTKLEAISRATGIEGYSATIRWLITEKHTALFATNYAAVEQAHKLDGNQA